MNEHAKKHIGGWVLLSVFATAGLTGCSEAQQTIMEMRQELRQEIALEDATDTQQQKPSVPSVDEIMSNTGADDIRIEETYEPVRTMGTPIQEITVALYFADAAGDKLVKTEKAIPKVEGMALATVETLLEGPNSSGMVSVIPEGTQLLDINVKQEQKKCIVDFSHELGRAIGSSAASSKALESIAKTLCQFDSIEEVEFRMEGQTIATIRPK
jgi:spore germination protein GerM